MNSAKSSNLKNNLKSDFLESRTKKRWLLLKWLILFAAYSFLAYKLLTFNQYHELAARWQQMPLSQFGWLVLVFILLPVNWLLEAVKWKMLTSNIQKLSLKASYKAVLAGISTGFFTPNRVGELVGRIMFLKDENRKAGVTLSVVNSLTQNIIMALCGIPACILFFTHKGTALESDRTRFVLMLVVCLLIFVLLYFALPFLSQRITNSRFSTKITAFTACLSAYTWFDLLQIMFISLLRYVVFCTQFYFMLGFFDVQLDVWQAFIAIPASYLFVTFTPSIAFSEAAVRSSYAVLFIGAFSGQVVGIALAGVCIWAVNFILPMLVGSVLMVRKQV